MIAVMVLSASALQDLYVILVLLAVMFVVMLAAWRQFGKRKMKVFLTLFVRWTHDVLIYRKQDRNPETICQEWYHKSRSEKIQLLASNNYIEWHLKNLLTTSFHLLLRATPALGVMVNFQSQFTLYRRYYMFYIIVFKWSVQLFSYTLKISGIDLSTFSSIDRSIYLVSFVLSSRAYMRLIATFG